MEKMKFKEGDRFVATETGHSGVILLTQVSALAAMYTVKWDHFPHIIASYSTDQCDSIWQPECPVVMSCYNGYTRPPDAYQTNDFAELVSGKNQNFPDFSKVRLSCDHEWKDYKGFTENYSYCKKCDEKRPLGT